MKPPHSTTTTLLSLAALGIITFTAASTRAEEPSLPGWARTRATEYLSGIDPDVQHNGKPSAFMESVSGTKLPFGTMSKFFKAKDYVGKRVQFKGFIKTRDVIGTGAGLWMRIDAADMRTLGFDNMSNRSLKSTTDWSEVSVVLDVPASADVISMGVLLAGTGRMWVSGLSFEVVDTSVPVTSSLPNSPGKLDFTQ